MLVTLKLPDDFPCFANGSFQFAEGVVGDVLGGVALRITELEIRSEPVNRSGAGWKDPHPDAPHREALDWVIHVERSVELPRVIPFSVAVVFPFLSHTPPC